MLAVMSIATLTYLDVGQRLENTEYSMEFTDNVACFSARTD